MKWIGIHQSKIVLHRRLRGGLSSEVKEMFVTHGGGYGYYDDATVTEIQLTIQEKRAKLERRLNQITKKLEDVDSGKVPRPSPPEDKDLINLENEKRDLEEEVPKLKQQEDELIVHKYDIDAQLEGRRAVETTWIRPEIDKREASHPDIDIRTRQPDSVQLIGTDFMKNLIKITNRGNAPATNMSIIFDTFPMEVVNVTNRFSTTNITLPQINNIVLKIGDTEKISQSLLEIRIPKLIHGSGSLVELDTVIKSSDPDAQGNVYAVYDQGSKLGRTLNFGPITWVEMIEGFYLEWIEPYFNYWIIFAVIYLPLASLYFFRIFRKRSLRKVTDL